MPGKRAIQAQLDRISESAKFDSSRRSVDFLQFVVKKSLACLDREISQHSIAGAVYGRGDDFDPSTDPIVRMQAGRVRRCLEHYYLTAGVADPVLIDLPKGSYVPTFRMREPAAEDLPAVTERDDWPTLLVAPLRNLTGRQDAEFIAQGLASDLAAELSRDKAIHVFLSPDPEARPEQREHARFELSGTVDSKGDAYKINFHLVDGESGRQTWAQTYRCPTGPNQGTALENVVLKTVALITEERGILSTHLSQESRDRPAASTAGYNAILRYHHFEATHDSQAFVEALAALRQAVATTPDCALCWSYLGRLGGAHWSLGLPGDSDSIEDSMLAARRGTELLPLDVRCRAILAYLLLITDEIDQARAEADVALQLNGLSTFWLDSIGYLLTLLGDWERGPELIRRALESNPYPRRICYSALWLDALHRDDTNALLTYARDYAPETFFWSPLTEAVALVLNNRTDEASTPIERLLELKPDFPQHAHWLITRYVKSDALVRRIEDALQTAGLELPARKVHTELDA